MRLLHYVKVEVACRFERFSIVSCSNSWGWSSGVVTGRRSTATPIRNTNSLGYFKCCYSRPTALFSHLAVPNKNALVNSMENSGVKPIELCLFRASLYLSWL